MIHLQKPVRVRLTTCTVACGTARFVNSQSTLQHWIQGSMLQLVRGLSGRSISMEAVELRPCCCSGACHYILEAKSSVER